MDQMHAKENSRRSLEMNGVMPDSIALVLPEEWDDVPLETAEFRSFVSARMDALRDEGGLERSDLRQFELLMAIVHQIVGEYDVIVASSLATVEPGQDEDEEDTLLIAGLTVSTVTRSALNTEAPLSAELMVKTFSGRSPTDQEGTRFDLIEPPRVCELGDLVAARLLRLMTVDVSPGQEFKQFMQTYLVPVADGDALIVLQFSTINFSYAREFSTLFESIANTLRILYPDDPTFLDESEFGES